MKKTGKRTGVTHGTGARAQTAQLLRAGKLHQRTPLTREQKIERLKQRGRGEVVEPL